MEKLTQQELNEVIRKHYKWVRNEEGGEKADLSYKNLSGLDLTSAILTKAVLTNTNLTGAALRYVNLINTNLAGADLTGANLTSTNLAGADLTGATFHHATLTGTILTDANLTDATLPEFQIPQDQDLIVWKKLKRYDTGETVLCKLLIPAGAARTANLIGEKCRAAKAKVLEFQDLYGDALDVEEVKHWPYNGPQRTFTYTKGAEAIPDRYDPDIREECTHGIHFFLTKKEAVCW